VDGGEDLILQGFEVVLAGIVIKKDRIEKALGGDVLLKGKDNIHMLRQNR
jgi:hypothetical protein